MGWRYSCTKKENGRPKRRYLDVVKEDMQEIGDKVFDRSVWRIC